MIHHLKTLPTVFQEIWEGMKTAEYRKNDRDFKRGDELILWEFSLSLLIGDAALGIPKYYTRRWWVGTVTHVAYGPSFGIPEGYCMMSLDMQGCVKGEKGTPPGPLKEHYLG